MARVGVVFGGRSAEHEVSIDSARTVAGGLREAGHEVVPLGIAPDGGWASGQASAAALAGETDRLESTGEPPLATLGRLVEAAPEVVFPIVHGTWGEDGTLQGFCEILDLPYVGAGVTASAVAMDKVVAKRQLEAAGIPVVEYRTARRDEWEADRAALLDACRELPAPLFVKPSVGGSSVGVQRVAGHDGLPEAIEEAFRFDDAVLVERGITGRELECAVLGYGELAASAIGEILPAHDFYDYEDKYLGGGAGLEAPADLPEGLAEELGRLAIAAFAALGGSGMARVDFLLDPDGEGHGTAYVNEINTLPGFTSISMFPRLWGISGLPLPRLVERLVEAAVERHRDRKRLDRGIKEFLAGLEARAGQGAEG